MSYNGDQAEAERTEVYRTEVYRTKVRRADEADAPEEFLWEGQVHRVRAVLTHRSAPAAVTASHGPALHGSALHGSALHEPVLHGSALHEPVLHGPALHEPALHEPAETSDNGEVWRVRASAGRHGCPGVFDLRFDWTAGRWTVTHISVLEGG